MCIKRLLTYLLTYLPVNVTFVEDQRNFLPFCSFHTASVSALKLLPAKVATENCNWFTVLVNVAKSKCI